MNIIRRLKRTVYILMAVAALLAPAALAPAAYAAAPAYTGPVDANGHPCTQDPAGQQVLNGIGANGDVGTNCGQTKVNNIFASVANILSIVAGVVAVIVIIYSGLKYMTSGGEQAKVANAKSTLLYAVIGLAVAALTQLMVRFVLGRVSNI
jgi:hypothetical protein